MRSEHSHPVSDLLPQRSDAADRRQKTVMFCDLAGSVALSEGLDVEDYRDLLNQFRHIATDAILQMNGYIARFQGDKLLVYFGYPNAEEDDAERAVRARLSVLQAIMAWNETLSVDAAVRVGIATGDTLVGDLVETGATNEVAAFGQTPNLAARLQSAADRNALLILQTTYPIVSTKFNLNDTQILSLKGSHNPSPFIAPPPWPMRSPYQSDGHRTFRRRCLIAAPNWRWCANAGVRRVRSLDSLWCSALKLAWASRDS
ncbi:MAG: class 3 adenylate cyclase [Gammaproteobacteria bacterium]|jgi:class 3 adenylate cyclase